MSTWTVYELYRTPDGGFEGTCETNDDQDRGYPTEYARWGVSYTDEADLLTRTHGGCHFGLHGQPVIVRVDGELVEERNGGLFELSPDKAELYEMAATRAETR